MSLGARIAWDDTVLPFQLDQSDIRGRVARLDGVLDRVLEQHDYPAQIEALAGWLAGRGVTPNGATFAGLGLGLAAPLIGMDHTVGVLFAGLAEDGIVQVVLDLVNLLFLRLELATNKCTEPSYPVVH